MSDGRGATGPDGGATAQAALEAADRAGDAADRVLQRGLGSPALFSIVYTALTSAVYFALGVVAGYALGLTPLVFLGAAVLFGLATLTYVEGASLHQDRAGASVFARYAFNELMSFVAGWAILLDYTILIAVTALSAAHYAGAFWSPLDHGAGEVLVPLLIVALVAARSIRGGTPHQGLRTGALVVADVALQAVLIVVGLAVFFDPDLLLDPIDLGTAPSWEDAAFALGVAAVVFTGLESASGLAGQVGVRRRGLRRLVTSATGTVLVVYVGISLVALTALPVVGGQTALAADNLEAPVLGITRAFEQQWLADSLTYAVAAAAVLTLVAAASNAMLGLSRLSYNMATNRQIPSSLGRLHPTRSTPFVAIAAAALIAGGLAAARDIDMLVGIYAFGALLGLTIAHVSIVVLRIREPDKPRLFRIPANVRVRNRDIPVPAVVGAVLSAATWATVVAFHSGARWVGLGWMAAGVLLYVVYRRSAGKSITRRVTVPAAALSGSEGAEAGEYGSILVPVTGAPLDDDIVQTAGRLAGNWHDDYADERGATIEAIYVFEIPLALPLEARIPDAELEKARAALRRAKAVGEEYEDVSVATATVRARRLGQGIVDEARRRGVEAIVLAAEEPSRIRGGALLGGRGGPRDNFVGAATRYVLEKAPCQVILTAAAADDPSVAAGRDGGPAR